MRFVCVYSLMINVILLFFKKFSIHFSNLLDFFLYCKKVECAIYCRKRRLRLNWKIMSFFFFIHFISCKFYLWWIAKSCLLNVVNVHSFAYSKAFLTFWQRNECILKRLISEFCLIYLITQLICMRIILYNSSFQTFAALLWKLFWMR